MSIASKRDTSPSRKKRSLVRLGTTQSVLGTKATVTLHSRKDYSNHNLNQSDRVEIRLDQNLERGVVLLA